ncbi:MAG: alpha/beta fold hydrolase, partial [Methylococcales bacterium]|nr:alpha/beta fold hydrolase [Methylococcales bacterium]
MNIHKEVYGTGDAIVLLHGWAMHTGVWREFSKKLAENYQVICLDLPSHGRSDYLANFSLENISQALIKQFPTQSCTVLGWSMGMTIALDLSQRFPKRINGLIGLAGNPCFVAQENWVGMPLKLLRRFNQQLIDDCSGTL